MPRYIDLIELEKRITENIKPETLEERALLEWCKDECIRQAYCLPIADVAPKSEVAKEIFAEIGVLIRRHLNDAGYIFGDFVYDVIELEKKYKEREQ